MIRPVSVYTLDRCIELHLTVYRSIFCKGREVEMKTENCNNRNENKQ